MKENDLSEVQNRFPSSGTGTGTGNGSAGRRTGGRWVRRVRDYGPPMLILLAVLAFCMWNTRTVVRRTDRWTAQLDAAEAFLRAGDADAARAVLEESRADFAAARNLLHMTTRHDTTDEAHRLYARCAALRSEELRTELSDLRLALADLSERERCTLGNIF